MVLAISSDRSLCMMSAAPAGSGAAMRQATAARPRRCLSDIVVFPPTELHPLCILVAHDLIGKPVTTFPDHAPTADARAYSIFNGGKTTPGPRSLHTARSSARTRAAGARHYCV